VVQNFSKALRIGFIPNQESYQEQAWSKVLNHRSGIGVEKIRLRTPLTHTHRP